MELSIFITCDYCPIGRNIESIDSNNFDFLAAIIPFSKKADLSITNLEAPTTNFSDKILKSGPNIKAKKKHFNTFERCWF